jgi:hypothetical protein
MTLAIRLEVAGGATTCSVASGAVRGTLPKSETSLASLRKGTAPSGTP